MTLAAPRMLWLLPALVLPLIGFFWWAWRVRQRLITQFISARLLGSLKVGVSTSRQKARMGLIVAAVVFAILALARPQWGVTSEEARLRGVDILVAIDTSNSMLAEDVPPNRLARAKLAALDLVRRAGTDRMGLIAFAGTAFLQCPLTLDDAAFSQSVDALDTKTLSQGGTAIAEAINEARRAFKNGSESRKVLVLFTDGEDHDNEAVAAAEKAVDEGMVIFTIGIGTPEGEKLLIRDGKGRNSYITDEQGQPVVSHLNEELLQQIARTSKEGFYLPLRGSRTMDTLYERGISLLPKTEGSVKLFQSYHERFHWPLAAAVALLVVEMFMPDRRRKRAAKSAAAPAAVKGAAGATALVLALLLPLAARADGPGSALREYNQGKFQDALKDYNQLLERRKDDPRLHFNAGAAAYQGRQMDEAARQFTEALNSPDLKLQQRAYYNLGNTLFRAGQLIPDPAKKQAAWENSVKQYDSALKLDSADADAKYNREFVTQQLEELKKQQQSQPKDDQQQKKDQNKKDQDKKDQQQKDQNQSQKNDNADSQSQKGDDKSKDKQDSQAQNQPKDKGGDKDKSDEKKPDQQQAKNQQNDAGKDKDKDKDKPQDKGSGKPEEQKSPEEAAREAAMMAAGQMTPQQAMQMLDAHKDDEQVLRLAPPNKNTSQSRPYKNW